MWVQIMTWGSGSLRVMGCLWGFTPMETSSQYPRICVYVFAMAPTWRSEGNLGDLILSFHYLGPGVEHSSSSGLVEYVPFSHPTPGARNSHWP